MRVAKAFARTEAAQRIACWVVAQYIRLVRLTGNWQVRGDAAPRRMWAAREPFILAFWHGRLLMMPYCWDRAVPINMLISRHADGRLIARTVGHFGIATIAGSSSKGGSAALRAILKALKSSECVGFTPDGPRGPRMRASLGVVNAARLAEVPILPCSYAVRRGRVLASWDRFVLAYPFSRGVFLWGEPIPVPRDADAAALERARLAVERSLNALTDEADRLCGREPIEPDPPAETAEPAAPSRAAAAGR